MPSPHTHAVSDPSPGHHGDSHPIRFHGAAAAYVSTKRYTDFSCCHRQPSHIGHCAFVHGYSRSFFFTFGAIELDRCGFVVDFGGLKELKAYLDDMFDHTLLLNEDDPLLDKFRELEAAGAAKIRTMPYGVGMEGTARHLCEYADKLVREMTKGRCWVESVESRENEKNSAIYTNPQAGMWGIQHTGVLR